MVVRKDLSDCMKSTDNLEVASAKAVSEASKNSSKKSEILIIHYIDSDDRFFDETEGAWEKFRSSISDYEKVVFELTSGEDNGGVIYSEIPSKLFPDELSGDYFNIYIAGMYIAQFFYDSDDNFAIDFTKNDFNTMAGWTIKIYGIGGK